MFFCDTEGNKEIVFGSKPYSALENALLKLYPNALKINYDRQWSSLFTSYPSMTAHEFSILTGLPKAASEKQLNELVRQGELKKMTTKNGSLWIRTLP